MTIHISSYLDYWGENVTQEQTNAAAEALANMAREEFPEAAVVVVTGDTWGVQERDADNYDYHQRQRVYHWLEANWTEALRRVLQGVAR